MLALVGATLLEGRGLPPAPDSCVLIDGDRIVAVGPAREGALPPDTVVRRLDGMTLLPGLIDTHVHLLGQRSLDPRDHLFVGEGLRAARATADLRNLLDAGITTVRDCGSYTALALKQAIAEGSIPGPRIVACGRFIERTGGADDAPFMPLAWAQRGGAWAPCLADGPDEVRKAVREQLRDGADWIKTCTTGAVTTQEATRPDILEWSPAELAALIDEAHRLGARVAVHAHAVAGIAAAVIAGCDSIEHGTYLDAETARLMADRGVWLVPTLFVLHQLIYHGAAHGAPDYVLRKARVIAEVRRESFEIALAHKVPIAMGTDCAGPALTPHGRNAEEIALMVAGGMSPLAAIVAATGDAAKAIGVEQDVGTIEVGKQADLIAVAGDPLADVRLLQQVAFVMQRGQLVVDRAGKEGEA